MDTAHWERSRSLSSRGNRCRQRYCVNPGKPSPPCTEYVLPEPAAPSMHHASCNGCMGAVQLDSVPRPQTDMHTATGATNATGAAGATSGEMWAPMFVSRGVASAHTLPQSTSGMPYHAHVGKSVGKNVGNISAATVGAAYDNGLRDGPRGVSLSSTRKHPTLTAAEARIVAIQKPIK